MIFATLKNKNNFYLYIKNAEKIQLQFLKQLIMVVMKIFLQVMALFFIN